MFLLLAITAGLGHNICERSRDHWTKAEQIFKPYYPNTMTETISCTSDITFFSQTMTKKTRMM